MPRSTLFNIRGIRVVLRNADSRKGNNRSGKSRFPFMTFPMLVGIACLFALLFCGCTGFMHAYTTPDFEGRWVKVDHSQMGSDSGFSRLRLEMDFDRTIKEFVTQKGLPDYIHVIDEDNVELVYLQDDAVYYFCRMGFLPNSTLLKAYPIADVQQAPPELSEHASVPSLDREIKDREIKAVPSKYDDFLNCVVVVRSSRGIGTGFFITSDGYLVTNAHVVENDPSVSIKLRTGRTILGNIMGINKDRDLALIKVDGTHYSWLTLGSIQDAGVGSDVLAVGTPEGLDWSVSKGIVSALRSAGGINLIQTDAAINLGNSGGPLIALSSGKVIGVNTLTFRKDLAEGLNFAVSAEEVSKAFPEVNQ
jgi:S1-C subfamily serine protease